MPYTLEEYQKLCAAIAQGVRTVKYADKELEYRSLADMKSIKSQMESSLGLNGSGRRKKVVFGSFNKGLQSPNTCRNEDELYR